VLEGQLAEVRALEQLTSETLVERRDTVLADLEVDGDGRPTLSFEGRTIVFPPEIADDVSYVAAADGPFRPSDLPGRLDEESRLVLVRRLVREGFLRRSGAAASG
jgi:hypothetical protein